MASPEKIPSEDQDLDKKRKESDAKNLEKGVISEEADQELLDFCGGDREAVKKVQEVRNKYEYKWWESSDPFEIAWGQLNEPILVMDFGKYMKALGTVLDRPVYNFELASSNIENLREEMRGNRPAPSLEEIIKKIPEEKRIVVLRGGSEGNQETNTEKPEKERIARELNERIFIGFLGKKIFSVDVKGPDVIDCPFNDKEMKMVGEWRGFRLGDMVQFRNLRDQEHWSQGEVLAIGQNAKYFNGDTFTAFLIRTKDTICIRSDDEVRKIYNN